MTQQCNRGQRKRPPRTTATQATSTALRRQVPTQEDDMLRRLSEALSAAAGRAVQVLVELMQPPTPKALRMEAARTVLELDAIGLDMESIQARCDKTGHLTRQNVLEMAKNQTKWPKTGHLKLKKHEGNRSKCR